MAGEAIAYAPTQEVVKKSISLVEAKEIMQSNFFGPEEIKSTYKIELKEIPEIPFSKNELEKAKKFGMELVLYADKDNNGNPFTTQRIVESLPKKTSSYNRMIYQGSVGYLEDPILKFEVPRFGWRLIAIKPLESLSGQDYLTQTKEIVPLIQNFFGSEIPDDYKEAIKELQEKDTMLRDMVESGDNQQLKNAAHILAHLAINELSRENNSDVLFRLGLHVSTRNDLIFKDTYTTTKSLSSREELGCIGFFDEDGVYAGGRKANSKDSQYMVFPAISKL